MFARSTTFKGKPAAMDAGIAMVSEQVMPAVLELEGCVGISMLVNRETGGSITTTAWSSEQAMRASENAVAPLRDRVQQVFGDRPEVRVWEIAVLHRMRPAGDGAWCRVTWTGADPAMLDQQLHIFRIGTLPQIEDLPGFCSASLMIDRATGNAALATTYESREALTQSREAAMDLRADAAMRMSARIVDVAEFEVALAHLRVPETV